MIYYAAFHCAAVLISWRAQSKVLFSCALALFIGWIFSVCWFFIAGKYGVSWGFAVVDAGLAAYFWRMSERKIFPTILFYLHAFLVAYYFYVTLVGSTRWWIAAFTNRIVELALLYVIFGSFYRIYVRRGRVKKEARIARASDKVKRLLAELAEEAGPAARGPVFPVAAMIGVGNDQRRDACRLREDHLLVNRRDLAPARGLFQRR